MKQRFAFCLLGGAAITLGLICVMLAVVYVRHGHAPADFFRYAMLPGIAASRLLNGYRILRAMMFVLANSVAYGLLLFVIRSLTTPLHRQTS